MSQKTVDAQIETEAKAKKNAAMTAASVNAQIHGNGYLAAINDIAAKLLKMGMTDAARVALTFTKKVQS